MAQAIRNTLVGLVVSLGIVFGTGFLFGGLLPALDPHSFFVRLVPMLAIAALLFALIQARTRIAVDALLLAITGALLPLFFGGLVPGTSAFVIHAAWALLAPVNWFLARMVLERRAGGLVRFGIFGTILLVQVAVSLWVASRMSNQGFDDAGAILAPTIWASPPEFLIGLPQVGLIVLVLVFIGALVEAARGQGLVSGCGIATVIALAGAMATATDSSASIGFVFGGVLAIAAFLVLDLLDKRRLDPITGLPRRALLYRHLERQRQPYVIVSLAQRDSEDFERRFGALAYQQLVRLAALRIQKLTGGSAFHTGDDGFVLVLANQRGTQAMGPLEHALRDLGDYGFKLRSWRRPARISKQLAIKKRGARDYEGRPIRIDFVAGLAEGIPGRDRHSLVLDQAQRARQQAEGSEAERIIKAEPSI